MKTIWKYPIHPAFECSVDLPRGAQFLDVQVQGVNQFCLWFLVDTEQPAEPRKFKVYGTGHELPVDPGEYLGTTQMAGGSLVFHAFECPRVQADRLGAKR